MLQQTAGAGGGHAGGGYMMTAPALHESGDGVHSAPPAPHLPGPEHHPCPLHTASSFAAFDKMEEKVMAMEAEAQVCALGTAHGCSVG